MTEAHGATAAIQVSRQPSTSSPSRRRSTLRTTTTTTTTTTSYTFWFRRVSLVVFGLYLGAALVWNVRQHQNMSLFGEQQQQQQQQGTFQFSLPTDGILIVNTRFMQHQADLVDLAWARLELFQTFCLPTMLRQSFRNHLLWIIRTDPHLDPAIQDAMIQHLRPYPNFYLIHDNDHDVGNELMFRTLDYQPKQVVTGDYELLRLAVRQSHDKVVMETILDADDGIHLHLLRHVYNLAVPKLRAVPPRTVEDATTNPNTTHGWAVFCIDQHLEWRSMRHLLNQDENEDDDNAANLGLLQDVTEDFCVTPGLTYALAPRVPPPLVFTMSHMKFHENVTECHSALQVDCVKRLKDFPGERAAIRARTTASAGMRNMDHKFDGKVTDSWHLLPNEFGIGPSEVAKTKTYVQDHLVDFSKDNLKGQCAEGHSCKMSSKIRLFRLVQRLERRMKKKDQQKEQMEETEKDGAMQEFAAGANDTTTRSDKEATDTADPSRKAARTAGAAKPAGETVDEPAATKKVESPHATAVAR